MTESDERHLGRLAREDFARLGEALTRQGDPRGELIRLQQAGDRSRGVDKAKFFLRENRFIRDHIEDFYPTDSQFEFDHVEFYAPFENGFVTHDYIDASSPDHLQHRSWHFLRELCVMQLESQDDGRPLPRSLRRLALSGLARAANWMRPEHRFLTTLDLWDCNAGHDALGGLAPTVGRQLSHVALPPLGLEAAGRYLRSVFPNARFKFRVNVDTLSSLPHAGLDTLPTARASALSLELELHSEVLDVMASCEWPNVETLEVRIEHLPHATHPGFLAAFPKFAHLTLICGGESEAEPMPWSVEGFRGRLDSIGFASRLESLTIELRGPGAKPHSTLGPTIVGSYPRLRKLAVRMEEEDLWYTQRRYGHVEWDDPLEALAHPSFRGASTLAITHGSGSATFAAKFLRTALPHFSSLELDMNEPLEGFDFHDDSPRFPLHEVLDLGHGFEDVTVIGTPIFSDSDHDALEGLFARSLRLDWRRRRCWSDGLQR